MAWCPVIDMCYLLSAREKDQVAVKSVSRCGVEQGSEIQHYHFTPQIEHPSIVGYDHDETQDRGTNRNIACARCRVLEMDHDTHCCCSDGSKIP